MVSTGLSAQWTWNKPAMVVTLPGFRIDEVTVSVEPSWHEAYSVRTVMRVPSVGAVPPAEPAGTVIGVHAWTQLTQDMVDRMTTRQRADLIKREIMRLLEHEIEENLMIDGAYVYDPHGTGRCDPKPIPYALTERATAMGKYTAVITAADRATGTLTYAREYLPVPPASFDGTSDKPAKPARVAGRFPPRALVAPKERGMRKVPTMRGR